MKMITDMECEAKLMIFKDFTNDYNANSLSKKIGITPRGTLKILKKLDSEKILKSKKMGKSTFYKSNLSDDYAKKLIETLLIQESREKAQRWLSEFEGISKNTEIVILFGSASRDYNKAKDIDLLLVIDKKRFSQANEFIETKNKILTKPIHPIIMTFQDLENNLKDKNPALINAICEGSILYGQEKAIGAIKNVTSFQ